MRGKTSTVLSMVGDRYISIDLHRPWSKNRPDLHNGHFLRGTKPAFYLLRTFEGIPSVYSNQRAGKVKRTGNSCLQSKDVVVIVDIDDPSNSIFDSINSVLKRWNTPEDKIEFLSCPLNCSSTKWPAITSYWPFISALDHHLSGDDIDDEF